MLPLDRTRTLAAVVALLLAVQAAVIVARAGDAGPSVSAPPEVADVAPPPSGSTSPSAGSAGSPAPEGAAPGDDTAPSAARPSNEPSSGPLRTITTDDDRRADDAAPRRAAAPAPSGPDPARDRFEARFPDHAAAGQDPSVPATTRWALLIGINEHQGRTRDNVGSRQDAEELWWHLVELGWRQDHVLLLTDADATYENITQAIAWLARKTDGDSVAVFHYSGHTKKWYGQDADGDGEITDEGLWPSDNRHLVDSEWVARMAAVGAGRLWIDIGGCEAAGLNDPGLERPGRLLTFSSTETQKSYEDPSRGNSVWGYYLVDQALRGAQADGNGDGTVTVEEAIGYAAPRARSRTEGQRYGAQHAVVVDAVSGDFDLRIPRPPPAPEPEPSDDGDDGGGCALVLCDAPTRSRAG